MLLFHSWLVTLLWSLSPGNVGLFQVLKNCYSAVKEDGFLISREKINSELQVPEGFTVCMERTIDSERLVLLRKVRENKDTQSRHSIAIENLFFKIENEGIFLQEFKCPKMYKCTKSWCSLLINLLIKPFVVFNLKKS